LLSCFALLSAVAVVISYRLVSKIQ
jgi:hypothetical protein